VASPREKVTSISFERRCVKGTCESVSQLLVEWRCREVLTVRTVQLVQGVAAVDST
jgi:hypothetical protein